MLEVARAILAVLPKERPELPAIVGKLPEPDRLETSIHYFHDPLAGPETVEPRLLGPDGLAVGRQAPAAYARYLRDGKVAYEIVAVAYRDEARAGAAAARCEKVLATAPVVAEHAGARIHRLKPGSHAAAVHRGRCVAVVLEARNVELAHQAIAALLASLE